MRHDGRGTGGVKNPYVRFQKLDRPPLEPATTTLWDYPSQNYGKGRQGDTAYRGATPSHVVWQVLTRFTKEGDLVVDPFCGSGTTLDVCRDLARRGRGFDISPVRADVERADARALPLGDASVDLVFLDPPYADNLRYSDDERCIGKLDAESGAYQRAMAEVFDELARVVKRGGVVAVFVQDVHKADRFFSLGFELFALGRARFTPVDHVVVTRRGVKVESDRARRHGAFGPALQRGFSHLLVFKNDRPSTKKAAADGDRGAGTRSSDRAPRDRRATSPQQRARRTEGPRVENERVRGKRSSVGPSSSKDAPTGKRGFDRRTNGKPPRKGR